MSPHSSQVDQRRASPAGDAVGRDKVTNVHYSERKTQIDGWLEKLADEMREKPGVREFVDSLQYFLEKYPHDDVVGLEAKLERSGRAGQKLLAYRKKEAFAKLLEEWRAYPAAQEIIAYFLAKIEAGFQIHVVPMLGKSSPNEIDGVVRDMLVAPVLDEMSCGPFMLNDTNVAGMFYWLAEQCYVRWHS